MLGPKLGNESPKFNFPNLQPIKFRFGTNYFHGKKSPKILAIIASKSHPFAPFYMLESPSFANLQPSPRVSWSNTSSMAYCLTSQGMTNRPGINTRSINTIVIQKYKTVGEYDETKTSSDTYDFISN